MHLPCSWYTLLHIIIYIMVSLLFHDVCGKRNYNIKMPSTYCGDRPREIDGAVITSTTLNQLYVNSACKMAFMSDDDVFTSKRIMVRVESLHISDCDVRLRFFDGLSTSTVPVISLGCRSSIPRVFYSKGKYLTIRLDKRSNSGYNFRIVLTTVKRRSYCKSDEVTCGSSYCADRDLKCDGVAHCPMRYDEKNCINVHHSVGVGVGAMAGLGIAVLCVCLIGVVVTIVCCRRRGYSGRVLRSSGNGTSVTTTSTTVVPPPPPPGQPMPYQQSGFGTPYPQQPPAYSYPQQSPPGMYPPGAPAPYPQASYPPPPAYPGYPHGPPGVSPVNYNVQTEQVKVPH